MDKLNLPEVKEPLYFGLFRPSLLQLNRTGWDQTIKPTKDNPELHKQTEPLHRTRQGMDRQGPYLKKQGGSIALLESGEKGFRSNCGIVC